MHPVKKKKRLTKFRCLLIFFMIIYLLFWWKHGKKVNFSPLGLFFNLSKELWNLLKDQTLRFFTKVVTMNSFADLSSLLPHCAEIMLTIFPLSLSRCQDPVAKVVARTPSPTLFPPGTNISWKQKCRCWYLSVPALSKYDLIKEVFGKVGYNMMELRERNSSQEHAAQIPLFHW